MVTIDESKLDELIAKTNEDIETIMVELTDLKIKMEKAHFDLILTIEPNFGIDLDQNYLKNCPSCS